MRSCAFRGYGHDRKTHAPDHLAKFRRNDRGRYGGHYSRRPWLLESAAGGVHPCCIRVGLHSELGQATAGRNRSPVISSGHCIRCNFFARCHWLQCRMSARPLARALPFGEVQQEMARAGGQRMERGFHRLSGTPGIGRLERHEMATGAAEYMTSPITAPLYTIFHEPVAGYGAAGRHRAEASSGAETAGPTWPGDSDRRRGDRRSRENFGLVFLRSGGFQLRGGISAKRPPRLKSFSSMKWLLLVFLFIAPASAQQLTTGAAYALLGAMPMIMITGPEGHSQPQAGAFPGRGCRRDCGAESKPLKSLSSNHIRSKYCSLVR